MRIIGGEARGRRLLSPPDRSTRPPLDRIRESIFSQLEGSFEGRTVLDLYAGTGSLGLEALSRGARHALFVESAPACLSVLERNLRLVGFASRARVLRASAIETPDLSRVEDAGFALVFIFLRPPNPSAEESPLLAGEDEMETHRGDEAPAEGYAAGDRTADEAAGGGYAAGGEENEHGRSG